MTGLPFAATTPVSVARVGLRARDAGRVAEYYRHILGFEELSRDGASRTLGAGGRPLLVVEEDAAALQDDPRSAGLFHTAFLLPSRSDLGRWIRHAVDRRIAVDGASDHLVSEAIYLTDPEGNGVEIYADRARDAWGWNGDQIRMATDPLDVEAIARAVPAGDPGWTGAPAGTIIGHVHLRVGDPGAAEAFWREQFDFDTVARYGNQAVFLSSGGYHHHIGANSWRSQGAGRREDGRTGLAWVEMRSAVVDREARHVDPWGTMIIAVPGAPGT